MSLLIPSPLMDKDLVYKHCVLHGENHDIHLTLLIYSDPKWFVEAHPFGVRFHKPKNPQMI